MYVLTVTHGPDRGKKIELKQGGSYTVGSADGDSLTLEDPKVLDGHCSVSIVGERAILENHTASAGTWIGDRKIAKAELKPGIQFRIGDSQLGLTVAPRRAPEAEDDPLLGKIIGGYKLNEVVGRGGMGTVYKATQLSLHREIALKVLRPKLSKDKAFIDLFVSEARAAAQLVHPNVVQVYDAGTEGHVSYFSMEFMGNGSVEEVLARDKKIPWEEAILMVLEAAHGLDYAESKGTVHRDVKPDNLMINGDGRVKLADLGLAKRGESKADQGIIGTPHFIPPEQAMGKEVDGRADIYSLGATFFRMITGSTVFSGKTAKEIVLKHIKEPPPAASSLESSIPDEIDATIAKMLAKEPDNRYQSAKELIAALESICAHHGIKGAIIKKGLPKKVLIPVAILLLAAVGVAIHYATKAPETIIDQAEKERADRLAREKAEKEREIQEGNRRQRKLESDQQLTALQLAAAKLPAIDETYDEKALEKEREAAWKKMAKRYREFAASELAKEFGNDITAKQTANKIEQDLADVKSVQSNLKEWIQAQVKKANELDTQLRTKLSELRRNRNYGDAVNLCDRVANEKPSRNDPFREVLQAEWVNPLDKDRKRPTTRVPKVVKIIDDARKNMRKERAVVMREALEQGKDFDKLLKALPAGAPENLIRPVIEAARQIEERFPAVAGTTPTEIAAIADRAGNARRVLEKEIEKHRMELIEEDRQTVRATLRKQRSRDPAAIPNLVMECDIARAIDAWQLRAKQLKTEQYRRFADESIKMLRWVDYLFWRFHEDTKASLAANKPDAPLRTLTFDMPKEDDPDKLVQDRFTASTEVYKFVCQRRFKGSKEQSFGQMPMDWVYHAVFYHRGEPRWKEVTPVLEFALGIFCMETMQYDLAIPHFEKLIDGAPGSERYRAAAAKLLERAKAENAALTEYKELQSMLRKTDATAAEVQAVLRRLETFGERHGGTLFYLDVMRLRDPIRKDIDALSVPDLPEAPPR